MKVDPNGRVLRLTDPALFDYPWIYMVEPGGLLLKDEEVPILRKYLLNGGMLMADDFWGERQWEVFHRQIKRVLPGREFVELPMEHPIFHCVFDLKGPKNSLQTPNVGVGEESQYSDSRYYRVTWEYHDGEQCKEMHVRAIFDDKGRIMVIATHAYARVAGPLWVVAAFVFYMIYRRRRRLPVLRTIPRDWDSVTRQVLKSAEEWQSLEEYEAAIAERDSGAR